MYYFSNPAGSSAQNADRIYAEYPPAPLLHLRIILVCEIKSKQLFPRLYFSLASNKEWRSSLDLLFILMYS